MVIWIYAEETENVWWMLVRAPAHRGQHSWETTGELLQETAWAKDLSQGEKQKYKGKLRQKSITSAAFQPLRSVHLLLWKSPWALWLSALWISVKTQGDLGQDRLFIWVPHFWAAPCSPAAIWLQLFVSQPSHPHQHKQQHKIRCASRQPV